MKYEGVTLFRCDHRTGHRYDTEAAVAHVNDEVSRPDGWLEIWGLVDTGPLTFCSSRCAREYLYSDEADTAFVTAEHREPTEVPA